MVNELRCQKLLDGYRGAPVADKRALEEILARLSHLVTQHLSIREIDLNPVVVTPKGAVLVDCRVRVAEAGL